MRYTLKQKSIYLLLLLVSAIVGACSVERNNPISKTYHNTTSRYNGYFLAKEKLHAVEAALQKQMVYDYNKEIPFNQILVSTTAKVTAAVLEEVVKKAPFRLNIKKTSNGLDTC